MPTPHLLPIAELHEQQISELADLHLRVMHSLLTDLGPAFVDKYYHLASRDETMVGICATAEDSSMLGWVIGSPDPNRMNRRLRSEPLWFLWQLSLALLRHPGLLVQLAASTRTSSAPLGEGTLELTYLGVDSSARGQGLGRALLLAFLESARKLGFNKVGLSVETDNEAARAVYSQAGFTVVNTFREGRYNRQRMELTLK